MFGSKKPEGSLKVFSLFDSAANAYMTPFFLPTDGIAVRQVSTAKKQADSALATNGADFTLFRLGSYDPGSGQFFLETAPVRVMAVSEME